MCVSLVGLCIVLEFAWGLRGVLMRESLVPPFTHSNAFGSRIASAHWEQPSARVFETFIRLTGAGVSEGRLWSREALGADALSVELTLRLAGDGAAPVGTGEASGLGLWFATIASGTPRLAQAFAAPMFDDTAAIDVLSAVGVVFTAEGAQIVPECSVCVTHVDTDLCTRLGRTDGSGSRWRCRHLSDSTAL